MGDTLSLGEGTRNSYLYPLDVIPCMIISVTGDSSFFNKNNNYAII
jgi:hypothetical protein